MNFTYDPTAKAEALSRLIGALRQEADEINTSPVTCNTLARAKSVERQIIFLEAIQAKWQARTEIIRLEKIPPQQETAGGGQGPGETGAGTAQPFLTPENSQFAQTLAEKGRKAKE